MSRATAAAIGFEAVWRLLDPITPFGREARARAAPYFPGDELGLEAELERVDRARAVLAAHVPQARSLAALLSEVKDVRGSVHRSQTGVTLDAVELYEIKRLVGICQELARRGAEPGWPAPAELVPEYPDELAGALDPSGRGDPAFYIDDSFSPVLESIRQDKRRCEQALGRERARLKAAVESTLGLETGLQGELVVSRADPRLEELAGSECLQLTRETRAHLFFQLRPSPEQEELESRLARLKEREFRAEARVRRRLSRQVSRHAAVLLRNMEKLAQLDLLLAKARLGQRLQGSRPKILHAPGLLLTSARHPGVEESLRREGRRFTPVSVEVPGGAAVITGPNMGGKTVTLKTVALMVAMAQHGLLVPAAGMEFSLCDFIFYSGPESGTSPGLSAFASEVRALQWVLERKDQRGLVLLDEFARGTNPAEGFALAAALLAELSGPQLITLFATHFDGLAGLANTQHWQVRGLRGVLREDALAGGISWLQQHMDYRLEPAGAKNGTPRDALFVASLLGLDRRVLARAQRILEGEE